MISDKIHQFDQLCNNFFFHQKLEQLIKCFIYGFCSILFKSNLFKYFCRIVKNIFLIKWVRIVILFSFFSCDMGVISPNLCAFPSDYLQNFGIQWFHDHYIHLIGCFHYFVCHCCDSVDLYARQFVSSTLYDNLLQSSGS